MMTAVCLWPLGDGPGLEPEAKGAWTVAPGSRAASDVSRFSCVEKGKRGQGLGGRHGGTSKSMRVSNDPQWASRHKAARTRSTAPGVRETKPHLGEASVPSLTHCQPLSWLTTVDLKSSAWKHTRRSEGWLPAGRGGVGSTHETQAEPSPRRCQTSTLARRLGSRQSEVGHGCDSNVLSAPVTVASPGYMGSGSRPSAAASSSKPRGHSARPSVASCSRWITMSAMTWVRPAGGMEARRCFSETGAREEWLQLRTAGRAIGVGLSGGIDCRGVGRGGRCSTPAASRGLLLWQGGQNRGWGAAAPP
jgi:hypothetical protein